MDFASTRKISLHGSLLLAPLVLVLSGCATPIEPPMEPLLCTPNCSVTITLPLGNGKPRIPPGQMEVIVDEGSEITFTIIGGGSAARSLTRLKADEAIFIGPNGRPDNEFRMSRGFKVVRIAEIERCEQQYRIKIDEEIMCKVKYDIINIGKPTREPLDPWIIIRK